MFPCVDAWFFLVAILRMAKRRARRVASGVIQDVLLQVALPWLSNLAPRWGGGDLNRNIGDAVVCGSVVM